MYHACAVQLMILFSKCAFGSIDSIIHDRTYLSPLLEHQATDNESLSSEEEKATTSDTSTDDLLSSENEEILDDEMTTQAEIDDTMIEVTGEMVEHEMTAHMEDNISENQQNDMYVENEHNENLPHVTTSFKIIQIWICMVLFRIYFKFKLTKAALLSICGLYQSYCTTLLIDCAICFPHPFIIYIRLSDQVRWKRQLSLCVLMMHVTSCINQINLRKINHTPISFVVKDVVVN